MRSQASSASDVGSHKHTAATRMAPWVFHLVAGVAVARTGLGALAVLGAP